MEPLPFTTPVAPWKTEAAIMPQRRVMLRRVKALLVGNGSRSNLADAPEHKAELDNAAQKVERRLLQLALDEAAYMDIRSLATRIKAILMELKAARASVDNVVRAVPDENIDATEVTVTMLHASLCMMKPDECPLGAQCDAYKKAFYHCKNHEGECNQPLCTPRIRAIVNHRCSDHDCVQCRAVRITYSLHWVACRMMEAMNDFAMHKAKSLTALLIESCCADDREMARRVIKLSFTTKSRLDACMPTFDRYVDEYVAPDIVEFVQEQICSICNNDLPDTICVPNACMHPTCVHCLETWSERSRTCPMCQAAYEYARVVNRDSKKFINNTLFN